MRTGRIRDTGLRLLRPWLTRHLHRRWDIHVHDAGFVADEGPVIVASNHIGWLDGPLLIAMTPRPAHALVKSETFQGRTGWLMRFAGQIRVRRHGTDIGALRTARRALDAGQVVVVYPEGTRGDGSVTHTKAGAAWLAIATGVPVVPVAIFGTRESGGEIDSKPPRGARLDVVFGKPLRLAMRPYPRDARTVAEADRRIRELLASHVSRAAATIGRELPGPLPAEENADVGA